jgi:Kef-type K+ transport system membrane component KefB
VDVGLKADARQLFGSVFWLFVLLAVAALVSKLLGAGLGAWATGFTRREALQLGLGMTSRGEVGLIVASAGVAEGFLNGDVFAAVVGMVILTTLITPPLLRLAFSNPPPNSGKSFSRSSEQTTGE